MLMSIAFISCEKDEDELYIRFIDTEEYKEYFPKLPYDNWLPVETYYDSEWKCISLWNSIDGNWIPANRENIYITKSLDEEKVLDIRQGDKDYKDVYTFDTNVNFSNHYSAGNIFFFVKRDTIIVESSKYNYYKYVRVK